MTTISTLPPAPQPTDDTSTFNSKAFALLAALAGFVTEANAQAGENNTAASTATTGANTATTKAEDAAAALMSCIANAQAAAASAGASAWVSGASYAIGTRAWSLLNQQIYRRRTAGGGTTDPSLDATNWAPVPPGALHLVIVTGTSATLAANTDTAFTNSAACAATAPEVDIGEGFVVRFDNGRQDNTVDLGSRSMVGANGQIRGGVITLNTEPLLALRWWGDYYRRA